jgi:hypothetical protein
LLGTVPNIHVAALVGFPLVSADVNVKGRVGRTIDENLIYLEIRNTNVKGFGIEHNRPVPGVLACRVR